MSGVSHGTRQRQRFVPTGLVAWLYCASCKRSWGKYLFEERERGWQVTRLFGKNGREAPPHVREHLTLFEERGALFYRLGCKCKRNEIVRADRVVDVWKVTPNARLEV